MKIDGDKFFASGQYDQPLNSLAIAIAMAGQATVPSKAMEIEYRGKIIGATITGTVIRRAVGEGQTRSSLLSGEQAKFILVETSDSNKLVCLEQSGGIKLIEIEKIAKKS